MMLVTRLFLPILQSSKSIPNRTFGWPFCDIWPLGNKLMGKIDDGKNLIPDKISALVAKGHLHIRTCWPMWINGDKGRTEIGGNSTSSINRQK